MTTANVRSILRIVAVVTILVGGIGVSTSIFATYAIRQLTSGDGLQIQSSVSSAGWLSILSRFFVCAWGVGLYQLSPGLARHITSEPQPQGTPAPELRHRSTER
jgi:hypothetical protein